MRLVSEKTIEQLLQDNKDYLYHYWFGGDVCCFESDKLPGYSFYLGAYGDVSARLIEKATGTELEYVKDKRNSAGFYRKMNRYFNDEGLKLLLDDKHPTYELAVSNNNWWECYVVNKNTKDVIELGDILNADTLEEAIQEVKDLEDDFIECVKKA